MRILMIDGPLPTSVAHGGIQRWIYELAQHLTTLGHEVHIMGFKSIHEPVSFENGGIYYHAEPKMYFSDVFLLAKFVSNHINKLHKRYKFDLIHGHSGHHTFPAILSKGSLNIPLITTIHALVLDEYMIKQSEIAMIFYRRFLSKLPRNFIHITSAFVREYFTYKYSDVLVSVSQYILQRVEQLYHLNVSRAYVVHGGVPAKPEIRRMMGEGSKKKRLLFVGRITPIKGLHYLIKALPLMTKDVEVAIVGNLPEGGYAAYLRHLITKLRVQRQVKFLGSVSDAARTWKLYSLSDAFILPSIHETLGIAILEAMNFGLPVLASNVGGIPEVVKDGYNGLLFKARDPKDLADKAVTLLNDNELRERMANNAKRSVYRKTWSSVAKEYVRIYEKCIS